MGGKDAKTLWNSEYRFKKKTYHMTIDLGYSMRTRKREVKSDHTFFQITLLKSNIVVKGERSLHWWPCGVEACEFRCGEVNYAYDSWHTFSWEGDHEHETHVGGSMFGLQKTNQKVIYTEIGLDFMSLRQRNKPRCSKLKVLVLRVNLHFFCLF